MLPRHKPVIANAVFAVLTVILAGGMIASIATGLTNDQNTLLQGAIHLVSDGQIYSYVADVNPPLIFFLYSLPAYLVVKFHTSGAVSLHCFGALVSLASLTLIDRRALKESEWAERRTWLVIVGFLFFFASAEFAVFADRDYLFYVFTIPWIIERLKNRENSVGTAVFAAVGFCLKPYNFLIWTALLLFGGPPGKPLLSRVFSMPAAIVAVMTCLYLISISVYVPSYLSDIMPMALTTYRSITLPIGERLFFAFMLIIPPILFLELPSFPAGRRSSYALLLSAAGVFALNGGWLYTLYVVVVPATLVALIQLEPLHSLKVKSDILTQCRIAFVAFMLLLFLVDIASMKSDLLATHQTGYAAEFQNVTASYDLQPQLKALAGSRFLMLSTFVWASTLGGPRMQPLSIFKYDVLWPLPWLAAHPDDPRYACFRAQVDNAFLGSISASPSPTVIIDESPAQRHLPMNYSLLNFFLSDPAISHIFRHYQKTATLDECRNEKDVKCRFTIWQRDSTPLTSKASAVTQDCLR